MKWNKVLKVKRSWLKSKRGRKNIDMMLRAGAQIACKARR